MGVDQQVPKHDPLAQIYSPEAQGLEVIVEIGSGEAPLLMNPPQDFLEEFNRKSSVRWVAVDWLEEVLRKGRINAKNTNAPRKHLHFVHARGQELKFTSGSVAEVIMPNVLGGGTSQPNELIDEAVRILKPGGILKVIETYQPWVANEPNGPMDYIRKTLANVLQEVKPEDAHTPINERTMDEQIMERRGTQKETRRFIVYFRKLARER